MRRSGFFLPALSMGLLYSSIYVGLIIINLRGSASDGKGDFGIIFHFSLIACAAVALYFTAKKGIQRPLAAILVLVGVVCLVLPFLSGDMAGRIFNGRPPILAMSMALFMPVGLFLFFRTVPLVRAGFAFALVIAGSELLWALLFPLLSDVSSQLPRQQAFHIFSLCCWMMGGAGLCLGASLYRESAVVTGDTVITEAQSQAGGPEKCAALGLIFAAGIGVFAMMGLHMGMLMPKTAVLPELINIAHFVFLLLLPLAGRLLDENPSKLMLMGILGLGAVFLMGLFREYGLIGRMPLFYTLNFMQSILLLIAYTTMARLLKPHAAFPLLITMAHCLYVTHIGGVALRGLVQAVPYGVAASSLLLALGTAFCLWRFRRLLAYSPALWTLPGRITPESDLQKLSAFAAVHSLTGRERDILLALLQGTSREDTALEFGMAVRTVRHHLAGLLKKSGMPNKKSFVDYYRAWKP